MIYISPGDMYMYHSVGVTVCTTIRNGSPKKYTNLILSSRINSDPGKFGDK
jgi:hypothetical protein